MRAGLLVLPERSRDGMTPGVIMLALLPVAAAAVATVLWQEALAQWLGFVWLLALIPIFVLSHRHGWRGAVLALGAGMAAFAGVAIVGTLVLGYEVSAWYFGLVSTVLTVVGLGTGWLSDRLIAERARTVDAAVRRALEDPETGLPTRRAAELFLTREFAAACRGERLAVVLFDLDGFADFVDRHGRETARQVLGKVGDVFRETSRTADLSARWGSQEFLTVLPGEDLEGAGTFAERIRTKAGRLEFESRDGTVVSSGVTVSAGIAEFEEGMEGAERQLEHAHRALHAAKAKGGDCVILFDAQAHGGAPEPARARPGAG